MENWRQYESQLLWEQEFEQIFAELNLLEEGVVGNMWGALKQTYTKFKDWPEEQFSSFVKKAIEKLRGFLGKLYDAKKIKKVVHRTIDRVFRILSVPKHVKLAAGILLALVKLAVPAKILDFMEAIKLFIEMDIVEAFKSLLGISDIEEYIKFAGGIQQFKADVERNPMSSGGFLEETLTATVKK
jgi:hypothetical protein